MDLKNAFNHLIDIYGKPWSIQGSAIRPYIEPSSLSMGGWGDSIPN